MSKGAGTQIDPQASEQLQECEGLNREVSKERSSEVKESKQ